MWKRLNFSITGKKHLEKNQPCQDVTYGRITDDGALILVADGAGSSKFSHIGSRVLVSSFADYVEKNFERLHSEKNVDDAIN